MTSLRAGVIGAGVFGGYHAGKYAQDARTQLVGVFDRHQDRAKSLADSLETEAFSSLDALLDAVDVVTVATSASSHGAIGRAALEAGKHVLVEKPIAVDPADGAAMAQTARAKGLTLQVGHQERFVFAAMGLLEVAERPRRIEASRLNPYHERGTDVSVTLDLMTHDIDLARMLAGRAEAVRVAGEAWRERSAEPDRSLAQITFANGVEAQLEASRVHHERHRVMRVEYDSGVVEIDFVARTFSNSTPHALNPDFAKSPDARDPLAAGVGSFIAAVLGEREPAVSGEDGVAALTIARAVDALVTA